MTFPVLPAQGASFGNVDPWSVGGDPWGGAPTLSWNTAPMTGQAMPALANSATAYPTYSWPADGSQDADDSGTDSDTGSSLGTVENTAETDAEIYW